jgi:hypothetical protein
LSAGLRFFIDFFKKWSDRSDFKIGSREELTGQSNVTGFLVILADMGATHFSVKAFAFENFDFANTATSTSTTNGDNGKTCLLHRSQNILVLFAEKRPARWLAQHVNFMFALH